MTIGIYKLEFAGTSKCYIGQSLNIELRFQSHLSKMRKQESSIKLNDAYVKYGNPTLEILSECNPEDLDTFEVETIEIFDSVVNGFNTCSTPGGKTTLYGEAHPRCEYSDAQLYYVLNLLTSRLDLQLDEISKLTKVSKSVVTNISCLISHSWLKEAYPKEYKELEEHYSSNIRRDSTKNGPKSEVFYIISPNKETYLVDNITKFAKLHSLDKSHLSKLRTGERKSHKGWKLCPTPPA